MMEVNMVRNLVGVMLFVYLSSASERVYRQSNTIKDARADLLQQDMFGHRLSRKRMPRDESISSFLEELKDTEIVKKLLAAKKASATDSNGPSSYGNQYWGRKKQVTDKNGPSSFGKEYWGRKKEGASQGSVTDLNDASSETYKGKHWSTSDDATTEKEKRTDDISSGTQWDRYWNVLKTKTEEENDDDQIAAERLWKKYFVLKDDVGRNMKSDNQRGSPLHKRRTPLHKRRTPLHK